MDDDADSIASDNTRATSNVRALVVPDRSNRNRLPQYDIGQDASRSLVPAHQLPLATTGAGNQALVAHPASGEPGAMTNYSVEDSRSVVVHENDPRSISQYGLDAGGQGALTSVGNIGSEMVETVDERAITPIDTGGRLQSNDYGAALVETVDERAITPADRESLALRDDSPAVQTVYDGAITPVNEDGTVYEGAITPVNEDGAPQSLVLADGSSAVQTVDERAITPIDTRGHPPQPDSGSSALVETVDERAITPAEDFYERGLVPQSSDGPKRSKKSGSSRELVPREKSESKSSRAVVPHEPSCQSSSRELTRSGSQREQAMVPREDANHEVMAIVPQERSSSSRSLVPQERSSSSRKLDKDETQELFADRNADQQGQSGEKAEEKINREPSLRNIPRPDRGFSEQDSFERNDFTPESMMNDSSDADTWKDYDEGTITTNLRQSVHVPDGNARYDYDYDSTTGDSSVRAARYQQPEEESEEQPDYEVAGEDDYGNEEHSRRSFRSQESYQHQQQQQQQQQRDDFYYDQGDNQGSRHSRSSRDYEFVEPRSYREESGPSSDTYPVDNAVGETYEEASYDDANSYYSEQSDDSSTIKTYGSNYWSSLSQAKKEAVMKPATIYEDEEMSEKELRKPVPQSPAMDEASYGADSYVKGSLSVSGKSEDGSQYSTSTGTGSSGMGIVQRPGTARTSRRNDSREVEVSMDGFMHQSKRSVEDATMAGSNASGSYGSYSPMFQGGEKMHKLNPLHMYASLLAIMSLLVTVLFFAAHIGPFVVDTRAGNVVRGTQAAGGSNVVTAADAVNPNLGFGSMSSALAVDDSAIDQVWQIPADNGGIQVVGVPRWIKESAMTMRRTYAGASHELPLIWAIGASGGDIVAETISKCLSKVIAGNGRQYDVNHVHDVDFGKNEFKRLSNTDSFTYINVDLFTDDGISRAGSLGLTQRRVSELAFSPFLRESAEKLFVPIGGRKYPEVAARVLAVARHPMERALEAFMKEREVSGRTQMTLTEYVNDPSLSENNPFTRRLLGITADDPLGFQQRDVAIQILDEYALVGLYEETEETVVLFEKFLNWYPGAQEVRRCHEAVIRPYEGYEVVDNYGEIDPIGYNLLLSNYQVDLYLYEYVKALFERQRTRFANI